MKTLEHQNIPITIIGGGIHGTAIALRMLRDIPSAARHFIIVDKHPKPLTAWINKTERQGMTFLRSPAVHHISRDPLGIVEFAERHDRTDELSPPYSQPSTALFLDYCNDVLTELHNYPIYYQFEVAKLRWDKGAGKYPFRLISTDHRGFRSSCVVLAIGSEDCIYVPPEYNKWIRQFPNMIVHASDFSVDTDQLTPDDGNIAIVGGGLTAGTLARSLSERGYKVAMIIRKQLKTEQFDFPPIWLGPKALTEFAREDDFHQRYQIIQDSRGEGSITPDIIEKLKNSRNIDIYTETSVRNITTTKGNNLHIETTKDRIESVSRLILATGYRFNIRQYEFLRELLAKYPIPLVCGLPKLDHNLQFYSIENLYGSGTIAQLQIGPASSNIAGANLAYERFSENLFAQLP